MDPVQTVQIAPKSRKPSTGTRGRDTGKGKDTAGKSKGEGKPADVNGLMSQIKGLTKAAATAIVGFRSTISGVAGQFKIVQSKASDPKVQAEWKRVWSFWTKHDAKGNYLIPGPTLIKLCQALDPTVPDDSKSYSVHPTYQAARHIKGIAEGIRKGGPTKVPTEMTERQILCALLLTLEDEYNRDDIIAASVRYAVEIGKSEKFRVKFPKDFLSNAFTFAAEKGIVPLEIVESSDVKQEKSA